MMKATLLLSRKPPYRWTMPATSSPHSRHASLTLSARRKTTSAMPRKIARMRSSCWSGNDVIIVVGSPNSSNSNRLREVAANIGVPAYLVNDASELRKEWFAGKAHVGISAGASAPETLVQGVVARLHEMGAGSVTELQGIRENVVFPLPRMLQP